MNTRLAEYIESGKALGEDEREVAALALLHVGEDQTKIDAAWDHVVNRRLKEVMNGSALLTDGREGLAQIRLELAARHA